MNAPVKIFSILGILGVFVYLVAREHWDMWWMALPILHLFTEF